MADNVADRAISELNNASTINDNDLFLLEQNNEAKNLTGKQLTRYVTREVLDVQVTYVSAAAEEDAEYDAVNRVLTLYIRRGDGISTIEKTGASGATDTYTITFDTGRTSTFTVTNGSNISTISKTSSRIYNERVIDTYTVTLSNGTTNTFDVTNGRDGRGLVNKVMGLDPDEVNRNVTTRSIMKVLLPLIMPVGYIYISNNNQSPADLFNIAYGLTDNDWVWEKIEGRYLVTSGKALPDDSSCPTYNISTHEGGSYKETLDLEQGNGAAKIGFGNGPYNYTVMKHKDGVNFTDYTHVGEIAANWSSTVFPTGLSSAGGAALTGTQDVPIDPLHYVVSAWKRIS